MALLIKNVLLPLMVLVLFRTTCGLSLHQPTQTVIATNDLGAEMNIHCKSKQDDLGSHLIPIKGKYEFSLRPNFCGTTQFYCSFQWGTEFHYSDICIDSRDFKFCDTNKCLWSIIPKGPCMWNY
ncbi:hypothetical protein PRUPE_1G057000 [Prunus persica]|uniref:S-protein homolog n=1 Tax=Prunus persica TaxID=3760 RepID=M5XY55_PRUPE|nr:hypothetical protein PRUPE_1G057000 [Prunus persica]